MLGDQERPGNAPADEMFLDDALENRRVALSVPGAFGVDDRHGPTFANAQAVGFRSQDAALLGKTKLLQASFQELPSRQAAIFLAAFWRGLVAAEKNVTPGDRNTDAFGDFLL